jgi:hypothetical protein
MKGIILAILLLLPSVTSARSLPEPLPESAGQLIYEEMGCPICHGHQGQGDGFMAGGLEPKPRNFTSFEQMARLSDMTMAESIKNGIPGTAMPAWDLTDTQIDDVIKYIKTFLADSRTVTSICVTSRLDISTENLNFGEDYMVETDRPDFLKVDYDRDLDRVVIRPRVSNVLRFLRKHNKSLVRTHVILSGEESALIVVRIRNCVQ